MVVCIVIGKDNMEQEKICCDNESCSNHGFIVIDPKATNVICNVRGIVTIHNALFPYRGAVSCETCNKIIYEEKD